MSKKSIGGKRIALVFSILFASPIIIFVIGASINRGGEIPTQDSLFAVITIVIAYAIPQIIYHVYYWIKDGFSKDKEQ